MDRKTKHEFSVYNPQITRNDEIIQPEFGVKINIVYDADMNKEKITESLTSIFQEVLEYFD